MGTKPRSDNAPSARGDDDMKNSSDLLNSGIPGMLLLLLVFWLTSFLV